MDLDSDRGIDGQGRGCDKLEDVHINTRRLGVESEIADLAYKNYGKSFVWIDAVCVRE
jgi:hypothetical protein